jgi:hypothetical protein
LAELGIRLSKLNGTSRLSIKVDLAARTSHYVRCPVGIRLHPPPLRWPMYRDTILSYSGCRERGCDMSTNASARIGPRFSRGMESAEDTAVKHVRPRFSRGQEGDLPAHEREHEGEFAVGQERVEHHPELEYHGRFSRGQEKVAS